MTTTHRQDFISAAFVCAVAIITTLVPITNVRAQPADRVIGTWELNLAKSRFEPGPAPRSETRTYEAPPVSTIRTRGFDAQGRATEVEYPVPRGAGIIMMSATVVGADGAPKTMEYTAMYDGKDYPFIGDPNVDTISLKRIDDLTIEATTKKAGKVVSTGRRVISKDGKVMTITFKGSSDKGQTISNALVFDKR